MGNSVPFVKQKSKESLLFCQKSTLSKSPKMKLISASLLLGSAMADKWAKLGDIWSALGQSNNVAEDDRKIIELFTISSVANYGCWCRFGQYRPYKGPSQDTVDDACKQWYQNYDCLNVDFNADGTTPCNMDTDYVDVITTINQPFDMATDYATQCDVANGVGTCASEACHVDAVFIRNVVLFLADNTLNMTLSGWYGFDGSICTGATSGATTLAPPVPATTLNAPTTAAAATTLTVPQPAVQCCGAYPNRYPYRVQNGNRGCCVDTTYNTMVLECCPSNVLQPVGTC